MLPAGQTGEQDLAAALDNIFNHPNVGPFMAIRLIQRLMTSNPSPGYVRRVAQVFNDNGSGVRGDLGAVVKAILLDPEARPAMPMEIDGKLKEPLLRLTQLWQAYDATVGKRPLSAGRVVHPVRPGPAAVTVCVQFLQPVLRTAGRDSGQQPRRAGARDRDRVPEHLVTNYMFFQAFGLNHTNQDLAEDDVYIDFQEEMDVAADSDALIDMVAGKLLGGEISDTLRTEIAGMLARVPETDTAIRAAETIYFVIDIARIRVPAVGGETL